MQAHHKHVALLGAGAIAMLVYLMVRKTGHYPPGSLIANEAVGQIQAYPQAPPPNPSDFNVAGSPINLSYNLPASGTSTRPTVGIKMPVDAGNGACCGGDSCNAAGQFTTFNAVPAHVFDAAANNFAGYQEKHHVGFGSA